MKSQGQSLIQLLLAVLVITAVWCVLLPRVSTIPVVQQRLHFLDERGIDPSAMYYTELEAMDTILDRIEGRAPKSVSIVRHKNAGPQQPFSTSPN